MPNKQYIVVDKETNEEHGFFTLAEARRKLVELVMSGISAYIFTIPIYQ